MAKSFQRFIQSDKRNELVIEFLDPSMTFGRGTNVYKLSEIKNKRLTFDDVEKDFKDFGETSIRQIRNAFELIANQPKKKKGYGF